MSWLGWMAVASAAPDRLSWDEEDGELVECPIPGDQVVGGSAGTDPADFLTRTTWEPHGAAQDRMTAGWRPFDFSGYNYVFSNRFSVHTPSSGELFPAERKSSALCAAPGHCMEDARAGVSPARREVLTVSAACPALMYPVAGGFVVTGDAAGVRVTQSEATGLFVPSQWTVSVESDTIRSFGLEVHATCVQREALAFVRAAGLRLRVGGRVWMNIVDDDELVFRYFLTAYATSDAFAAADADRLLPLSMSAWSKGIPGMGLSGLQTRLLPAGSDGNPLPAGQPSDEVRVFGFTQTANESFDPFGLSGPAFASGNIFPYVTTYGPGTLDWMRGYPAWGRLLYVAPADRSAFEAAVYCDDDPPDSVVPWWADLRIPRPFASLFRPIVWLPPEFPYGVPRDPVLGDVFDGLPVGFVSYAEGEDPSVLVAELGAMLDEARVRWIEVQDVSQTLDQGNTIVVVVPERGSEVSTVEWVIANRDGIRDLTHPTLVFLPEEGEGWRALD